jgi:multimeric flavodoxin WrbA/putative sterol carrier protein
MEDSEMTDQPTVVAVNGSPHAGYGNTAQMIEMLRAPLAQEGFALEVITLGEHRIDYCLGCAFCLEKGRCWIPDDHAGLVKRLLAADGIVLASPVYVFHVTAQMKTFLDRSLAFGHKPQPTWKPGLAVSVSAGLGETQVAEYLASVLRIYGAFAVGRLTAMATSPGDFLGREAVAARAGDLARDLARAVREKRRYPATDMDLRYYQFMGGLVRDHRDSVMRDDHDHWERLGLMESFEAYIQQKRERPAYDPEIRRAWLQAIMAGYRSRGGAPADRRERPRETPAGGAHAAASCRELLQAMPLGFDPAAAEGLAAVYQFEISGAENFTAHLAIGEGRCVYRDGPAENPGVIIRSPADVWLMVSRGELDGQQAFLGGRYTAAGDLGLLLKLRRLFPG